MHPNRKEQATLIGAHREGCSPQCGVDVDVTERQFHDIKTSHFIVFFSKMGSGGRNSGRATINNNHHLRKDK
jgi:hypothetical protein